MLPVPLIHATFFFWLQKVRGRIKPTTIKTPLSLCLGEVPLELRLLGTNSCNIDCSLRLLNDFRLALKAFTDQKRRFFPHLDDGLQNNETASKKHCGSEEITMDYKDEISNLRALPDVLKRLGKEVPSLEILTFERLDWLKRSSSLSSSTNENSVEHSFHGSNTLRPGSFGAVGADKVAVIELLFPSVFRAVVSLHPAGSIDPDAVAFFSPDEVYLKTLL